jgi:hypothetical protein
MSIDEKLIRLLADTECKTPHDAIEALLTHGYRIVSDEQPVELSEFSIEKNHETGDWTLEYQSSNPTQPVGCGVTVPAVFGEMIAKLFVRNMERESLSQWQPIETAPRDGTFILVIDDAETMQEVVYWWPEEQTWVSRNLARYGKEIIAWWIPIPPMPTRADEIEDK